MSGELSNSVSKEARDLPTAFCIEAYRRHNPDLHNLPDAELEAHYRQFGDAEGRTCSAVEDRAAFFGLLGATASVLEIGPLANPSVSGPNVKYFDVAATDGLRETARANGLDPKPVPRIDFVSPIGDLSVIDDTFDAVVSSHAIEHQPDLIRHLLGVARLLKPGGRYFLAIPDKRYCFDHFMAASTVADVLDAFAGRRQLHRTANVVAHLTLKTHNDPGRHWQGDHGEPLWHADATLFRKALRYVARGAGQYLDTHAWQFTPESFRELVQILAEIELSPLRLLRLYPTRRGTLEFYAVLEKVQQEIVPLDDDLPAGFDAQAYLKANPDVALAGVEPALHYLEFGRREGRRLKI